jgi:DNA topoisomerase IA
LGKILVVAEKPSVGRDYAKVLGCKERGEGCLIGPQYVVTWAVGHLIELCEPEAYDEKFKRWNYRDLPIIPQSIQLQVIKNAKKLLSSTELSSAEIAEKLNFSTPSFFCRYFKRYTGTTPQEWRVRSVGF